MYGNETKNEESAQWIVHPAAVLVPSVEGGNDLQPLDRLLLALSRERAHPLGWIDLFAEHPLQRGLPQVPVLVRQRALQ